MSAIDKLPSPVQFLEKRLRFAPRRTDLYVQLQVDAGAHQSYNLGARRRADLLEHLSLPAHQDPFLPFALTMDSCRHPGKLLALLEFLDHDRGSVRYFLAGGQH